MEKEILQKLIKEGKSSYEIAKDKETCLVVLHQNSKAIFEAIQTLLTDEKLCHHLKINGLEIAKNFTIENKVKAIEKIYSI